MKSPERLQEKLNSLIQLYSNEQYHEALKDSNELAKQVKDNPVLQNIIGACYAGIGDFESAIEKYLKAISINPNYAKAYFNLALTYHNIGELEKAKKNYKNSIEIDAHYAEAHNNLGSVFRDLSEINLAVNSFKNAIKINPNYLEAHYSISLMFFNLGEINSMIKHLKKVIELKPNFAQAHNLLGVGLKEKKQFEGAIQSYKNAIKHKSNFSDAHNNLGNAFMELDELNFAVESYKQALKYSPDFPSIHINLGNALKKLNKHTEAIKSYEKALLFNEDYPDSYNSLGVVYFEMEKFDESIEFYEKAIKINPSYAEAYNNLGAVYKKLGNFDEAIGCFESALSIKPNFADAYGNLGHLHKKNGLPEKALICYEKASEINPNDPENYNNLGVAYSQLELLDKSLNSYEKAIGLDASYVHAHNNLGHLYCKLDRHEEAIASYEKAFNLDPKLRYILGNILSAKAGICQWTNLEKYLKMLIENINNGERTVSPFDLLSLIDDLDHQMKAARLYVNREIPLNETLPKIKPYKNHKKIRLGYFSADFKIHPVATLTAELYELHDRDKFEVHAFSFGPNTNDEMNLRIKAGVDHFHDVKSMSHKEITLLARSFEIDIAIDLGGHTADARTEIFAMSAAPIQVSYIGYLGTMGADYYDYLIADPIMIPIESQKYYTEKIAYLPSFQVNDSTERPPEIVLTREDIGLPEEGFVFCCFNNTYKLTPKTFDSWARILKKVEDSVLIIFANNELSKTNLRREIIDRGVDSKRLIFGESLARPEYLARYRLADLFLDTLPYNAGTTASDALRMGLPILTIKGDSYQARMGASIINAVGLPELITNTMEEYESLAIELAKNTDKLAAIKYKLTHNLSKTPLYNSKQFALSIETAFTEMNYKCHQGLKFDHIYVEL